VVKLAVSLIIAQSLTGCGLIYTVVNSESKLDRLSLPMTKTQVVEEIGRPDRVIRDDGRVLVWEYSLTARRQWLYELSLCPVSIWIGGCIFYPFTNTVAQYNREYPYHVVLLNDQLCAWGSPLVMLKKRKACVATDSLAGSDGVSGRQSQEREPVTTGSGPINSDMIDRYQTLAVMAFADAPGTPGSGAKVTGIVTNLFLDLDMTVVERTRLEQVFREQVVQLQHGDDGDALRVGKLVGAKAIVIGEVQEWETREPDNSTHVSLSLRMIDVESGLLLFGGEGHLTDYTRDTPEVLARRVAHRILARFGVRTGLLGTGRIGVNWNLRELSGSRAYLVQEIRSGSPADKAGLKVGDVVLSCNGSAIAATRTERQAKRACQIDTGQTLSLEVLREDQRLLLNATAEKRPGI